MLNILVKFLLELHLKNSKLYLIQDHQIYGFHLIAVGLQLASYIKLIKVKILQLIKKMEKNLKSNMDLEVSKPSLVKMLLNLLEFKLKMFNLEKLQHYQV